MHRFSRTLAGLLALSLGCAPAGAASLPPYTPPTPVQDIGAATSCPFILIVAGQSNAEGWDSAGSKTIASGIYITNDRAAPTAVIPAVYGMAPLNASVANNYDTANGVSNSTVVTSAAAWQNQGVSFANSLRASGLIPASRPIVIVPDYSPGKSITHWIDDPATMAAVAPSEPNMDLWARLTTQLAVLNASTLIPTGVTCPINHVIWDQGENDVSTVYGTQATYLAAFDRLITKFKALPQWGPNTTMSVVELATWIQAIPNAARNDALRQLRNGAIYPFVTMVTSTGLVNSTDSPSGPHYDGNGLIILGQRHFAAWRTGNLAQQYVNDQTYYGSTLTFPNQLSFSSAGGTINPDDIRTGAVISIAGGTVTLPWPRQISYPLYFVQGNTSTAIVSSGGLIIGPNNRNAVGSVTMSGSTTFMAIPIPATSTWRLVSIGQYRLGDQGRAVASTYTGTVTFDLTQAMGVNYTFNGATITLPVNFGVDMIATCQTAATTFSVGVNSFILPDGSTPTSFTCQPGETVKFDGISSGGSGYLAVTYLNRTRLPLSTVSALPTCNAANKGLLLGVTDATSPTYNGTLTGSGAVSVPVYCNGSAWTAH